MPQEYLGSSKGNGIVNGEKALLIQKRVYIFMQICGRWKSLNIWLIFVAVGVKSCNCHSVVGS